MEKRKQIGTLFLKISEKTGKKYFSGKVGSLHMVGFLNESIGKAEFNKNQPVHYISLYEDIKRKEEINKLF